MGQALLRIHIMDDFDRINFNLTGMVFLILLKKSLIQKRSFERFPLNWLLYIIHGTLFAFLAAYCEMKRGDEYIHYTLYFLTVVVSFQVLHNLFIKYYFLFNKISNRSFVFSYTLLNPSSEYKLIATLQINSKNSTYTQ